MNLISVLVAIGIVSGYARLNHIKVGNINNTIKGKRFTVTASDMGINLGATGNASG